MLLRFSRSRKLFRLSGCRFWFGRGADHLVRSEPYRCPQVSAWGWHVVWSESLRAEAGAVVAGRFELNRSDYGSRWVVLSVAAAARLLISAPYSRPKVRRRSAQEASVADLELFL